MWLLGDFDYHTLGERLFIGTEAHWWCEDGIYGPKGGLEVKDRKDLTCYRGLAWTLVIATASGIGTGMVQWILNCANIALECLPIDFSIYVYFYMAGIGCAKVVYQGCTYLFTVRDTWVPSFHCIKGHLGTILAQICIHSVIKGKEWYPLWFWLNFGDWLLGRGTLMVWRWYMVWKEVWGQRSQGFVIVCMNFSDCKISACLLFVFRGPPCISICANIASSVLP